MHLLLPCHKVISLFLLLRLTIVILIPPMRGMYAALLLHTQVPKMCSLLSVPHTMMPIIVWHTFSERHRGTDFPCYSTSRSSDASFFFSALPSSSAFIRWRLSTPQANRFDVLRPLIQHSNQAGVRSSLATQSTPASTQNISIMREEILERPAACTRAP